MLSSILNNTSLAFTLDEFFNKEIHLRKISSFVSEKDINYFLKQIDQHPEDSSQNIRMDDGYFYPFPYSTIHDKAIFDENHPYFTSGEHFHQKHTDFINSLQSKLENLLQVDLHSLSYHGSNFSKFNCRILYAQKMG